MAPYREPDHARSLCEIALTVIPYLALLAVTLGLVGAGHLWALLLTVPAAAFLVRLFLIQHDCGHGSLFRSRAVNDWVGRVIGVMTLTPYDYWRRTHAVHHATSGNLDRRELGGLELLTVAEYTSLSEPRRRLYRLYRHPLVLFGVGPAYMFFLQHRIPVGLMRAGWRPWLSVLGTNLSLGVTVTAGVAGFGAIPFLLVLTATVTLAATAGVWLFYVQHQFEQTSWSRDRDWRLYDAALQGSSFYDLPPVLRWFTANIGVHHVHHLNSRIPFYRLPKILADHPMLAAPGRLTIRDSLGCVPLALWDEDRAKLVSFRSLKVRADAASQPTSGQLERSQRLSPG